MIILHEVTHLLTRLCITVRLHHHYLSPVWSHQGKKHVTALQRLIVAECRRMRLKPAERQSTETPAAPSALRNTQQRLSRQTDRCLVMRLHREWDGERVGRADRGLLVFCYHVWCSSLIGPFAVVCSLEKCLKETDRAQLIAAEGVTHFDVNFTTFQE